MIAALLARLRNRRERRRLFALRPDSGRREAIGPYRIQINDGPNFYMMRKDIFERRIYHFEATRSDPVIIDGGANIGLATLYYKTIYPAARIRAFDPDPAIAMILKSNIKENGVTGVEVIDAALGGATGMIAFVAARACDACIATYRPEDDARGETITVPIRALRDELDGPVDLLKLNIEGAEWEALEGARDRLKNVREMIIEYHHLPGLPRTLHRILGLLDEVGFDYLINDIDGESNRGVLPPFRLERGTRYFLLVYAKRRLA